MAYVPPITFSAGSALLSGDLQLSFKTARDYINAEVAGADYGARAFDRQHIAEGMDLLSFNDWHFETGSMYTTAVIADDKTRRRYAAGTIKNSDITQQILYQQVPGTSRRIWLDATGDVWIEGYGSVVTDRYNTDYAYRTKTLPTPATVDSRFYLEVDGTVITNTRNYSFDEGGGSPSAQSIASSTADFGTSQNGRRPLYLFWVAEGLSAGWHTIRVVVDCRSEWTFLGRDSFQIEVFSNCGLTSYTGSDYLNP